MQAFGLQPLYGKDAAQMLAMLLGNLADVAAALQQAASELASGNLAILQSLTGDSWSFTKITSCMHGMLPDSMMHLPSRYACR